MDTIILEPFVFLILKLTLLVKRFEFYIFVVMKEKILELRINGKSMKQIARELGCAHSTVSYHCNKAGLGGDGINRKILTEYEIDKIKELYSTGCSNDKLSKEFSVSKYEIRKYTKELKRYSRFDDSLTRKQRTSIMVSERRRKNKDMAIEYKGGKCEKCGYNKCNGALEFHHLNPEEKDFSISTSGTTKSFERIKKEIDKCILVCANCHREIHYLITK